ncbi:hypothetical protein [Dyadobacter sp. CY347]|uniref:hypothetical protein n=1 Tax=Dyadobacter sp. CY347 TaxID=2909336 RepID=UPI001F2B9851|nr:hypothetical protein [Dyadobacter sp. CY347]MCF2487336.1 hypothetical protein [Dyadobacter sp. CY347]
MPVITITEAADYGYAPHWQTVANLANKRKNGQHYFNPKTKRSFMTTLRMLQTLKAAEKAKLLDKK